MDNFDEKIKVIDVKNVSQEELIEYKNELVKRIEETNQTIKKYIIAGSLFLIASGISYSKVGINFYKTPYALTTIGLLGMFGVVGIYFADNLVNNHKNKNYLNDIDKEIKTRILTK